MDSTAIAAASVNMSLSLTQQSASTAVLKKSMNLQQTEADGVIQMMANLSPNLGQNLDVSA